MRTSGVDACICLWEIGWEVSWVMSTLEGRIKAWSIALPGLLLNRHCLEVVRTLFGKVEFRKFLMQSNDEHSEAVGDSAADHRDGQHGAADQPTSRVCPDHVANCPSLGRQHPHAEHLPRPRPHSCRPTLIAETCDGDVRQALYVTQLSGTRWLKYCSNKNEKYSRLEFRIYSPRTDFIKRRNRRRWTQTGALFFLY